jgi:alcohol dehydrogenase
MFSVEGFRNAWKFLEEGKFNSAEARIKLALASINGIYGLMNSGDGPTNGFAYYFGVKDKIPHGYAGGMFLRDVMRWNYENGFDGYEKLIESTSTYDMNTFFDQYSEILRKYSVPTLKNIGYSQSECIALIDEISTALGGSFSGNPIGFDKNSAKWVLNQQFTN